MLFLAISPLLFSLALGAEIEFGSFGTDAIFVHPLLASATADRKEDSIRAMVTVDALRWNSLISRLSILPTEVMVASPSSKDQVELTRFKAAALRAAFSQVFPVDILAVYRDLDRKIDYGVDVIGLRVPVRVTQGGAIVLMPGLELGVRRYQTVEKTSFHSSFILESRAALALIESWLSLGLMARVRYDLESVAQARGFEESAMGYLSLLLDPAHRLYVRIYTGIEHQASRESLGLPAASFFTGLGLFGNLGYRASE